MEEQMQRVEEQLQDKYRKQNPQRTDLPKQQDIYHKPRMFSIISNDAFANYIAVPLSGFIWVLGYLFANQHKVSPIESNFARYIFQIIIQIPLMYFTSQPFYLKHQRDLKLLVIRALISALNGVATAIFQLFLPLTVYYTLSASTVIFTFLLNFWLYKADLSSNQIKAIILALIGIALVINGRAIYQAFDQNYHFQSNFDYSSTSTSVILLVSFGVVVWSFVWAYGIVITGKHHSTINQLVLINSLTGIFVIACLQSSLPIDGTVQISHLWTRKPEYFLSLLVYTGLPLALANYIFNLAFFLTTNSGVTILISEINILYVYFISTIRYDQDINYVCLIGAILLLYSIYKVLFKK